MIAEKTEIMNSILTSLEPAGEVGKALLSCAVIHTWPVRMIFKRLQYKNEMSKAAGGAEKSHGASSNERWGKEVDNEIVRSGRGLCFTRSIRMGETAGANEACGLVRDM